LVCSTGGLNRLDRAAKDRISNQDGRISSDDRFSRAADMVQAHGDSGAEPVAYAFDILRNVASRGTRWSIVYDLRTRTISFRTTVNPRIRTLAVEDFNFACGGLPKDPKPPLRIQDSLRRHKDADPPRESSNDRRWRAKGAQ
jgi:penicillin V acylase-like amidase (Ntn superfamily)